MIYQSEVEKFYSQIPQNSRVCIWGASNAGIAIKEELSKYRQDVEVIIYIDTRKSGSIDNIKIYKPDEIETIKESFDFMIVSTRSDCTVIDAFLFYYDIPYIRIPKELLKLYQFIPSKVTKVLDMLKSNSDKNLYMNLLEARITQNTTKIQKYVLDKHNITADRKRTIKHYTSYINSEAIKYILEGGMFNGLNTIVFKRKFKNLKKIYAFELLYEKVKNPVLDFIIKGMKELEIIQLALWSCKTKLEFTENVAMPYSSGIKPKYNRNDTEQKFMVNTISIDEYMNENNIHQIDFIKMDIEGAELNALIGAEKCLINCRPQLAISIYHSDNDMVDIPLYLNSILKQYVFKIGQYSPDNDETILYAIPEELYCYKD